jgi:hypothetical protein
MQLQGLQGRLNNEHVVEEVLVVSCHSYDCDHAKRTLRRLALYS